MIRKSDNFYGFHKSNGAKSLPILALTHTNCYILGEPGGQRVIVDPAARDEDGLSMLKEKIKQVLESGSEIIATIFTHRHKDHVGNLDEISEIYVAPIWATQETLASIPHCELSSIISEGESFTLSGVNGQVKWDINVDLQVLMCQNQVTILYVLLSTHMAWVLVQKKCLLNKIKA